LVFTHSYPQTVEAWLSYIEALHTKEIELGLRRVAQVKDKLNLSPKFPIIIVAGTNGKGSTCAMLSQIYQSGGYRVGCYTSPHLIEYQERIRINQSNIPDDRLIEAFNAIEEARGEIALTYFEFGTLAAMWYFQNEQVDMAVLEIGMGGRLDAVNIFEPDCSIVTSIDLDHMEYLGDTREAIGREKAGVYRTYKPAICADPNPPQSLLDYAQKINADLYFLGREFYFTVQANGWDFVADTTWRNLPFPSLKGQFQLNNASAVLMAIQLLQNKLPMDFAVISQMLGSIQLSGRFQTLRQYPQVIVDVAHNPHAANALFDNLVNESCSGKTIAVLSMLADKDVTGVASILRPMIDEWHVAALEHPRSATIFQLNQGLNLAQIEVPEFSYESIEKAYQEAYKRAGENDRIVVFGSFYTVAAIMRILQA
jgi:dihydrofolate synthase/folylpolyglutamate synthase